VDEGGFRAGCEIPRRTADEDLKPGELERILRKRGPQKTPTKIAVSIRLSPEVVEYFKAKGPGWQSRIDDALRKIAKKKAG
jgi:uncharacterized protein (DUF4415 family)